MNSTAVLDTSYLFMKTINFVVSMFSLVNSIKYFSKSLNEMSFKMSDYKLVLQQSLVWEDKSLGKCSFREMKWSFK